MPRPDRLKQAEVHDSKALKTIKNKLPKVKLIRLHEVLEIVQATIWTGRLSGENPVSLCLVATQESAKSQCLLYFYDTPTLKYFSDITTKPLTSFRHQIETKQMRHLVLLDLVQVMNHGKGVAARTLQRLGGMMEEGQAATADAGGIEEWKGMPKIGVMMALTTDYFVDNRTRWYKSGFITRFLRVWFDYSDDTVQHIHRAIADGTMLPEPQREMLPEDCQLITLKDEQAMAIEALATSYAEKDSNIYGFRYHRQQRALAKALALLDGRHEVDDSDIRKLTSWQPFFTGLKPVTL